MTDTLIDRRQHNFFVIDNAIWQMGLSPFELAIYCALAHHADRSGVAWPGVLRLATMTNMSERKTRDCLAHLQSLNLIDVAPNYRPDGGQTSNTYILYPPVPPAPDAATPLHHMQPPPAPHAAKQDSEEQEDGECAAPPPVEEFPETPEPSDRSAALDAVQVLGLFNSTDRERFNDLWPELAGRADWIGRAVTVTRDAAPRAPVAYCLKVLANCVHTNTPPGNIGNNTGDTFWSGGATIVAQCYAILRPGGYAAFVTGDFVRNKQRVPFGEQWLALCESVGFEPVLWAVAHKEEYQGTQTSMFGEDVELTKTKVSFFRRLANRNNPDAAITNEDVLFVRKPQSPRC